jgi:hypothetical protein
MKKLIITVLIGIACIGCRTGIMPLTAPLITWRSSVNIQNNFALDSSSTSSNAAGAVNGVAGGADVKLGVDTNAIKAAAAGAIGK